jgi:cell wall-associated NlpC family hydrolase
VVFFATRAVTEQAAESLALVPVPEEPPAPPPAARTRRKRVALTLVYTTLFFAGAALTAGAGNELAHIDDGSTIASDTTGTTDTTTVDATTVTVDGSTDAAAAEPAAPVESPTLAPAPAPDPAPAAEAPAADPAAVALPADPAAAVEPVASPEPTPVAVPAEVDPSDATPVTHSSEQTAAADVEPASAPTVAPAHHAAKKHRARKVAHKTVQRTLARLPIPFQAIAFDPQAWLHNNPASPTGASAVAIAMHYLGVPYRWGGAVPATGFDCSGLTRFVYGQLGVDLVHYAATQFASYPKLDPAQLQPGDLVFFEPKLDGPGHVALYIGNDQIIEAPHTGALVRINSLSREAASLGFLGAVRPYAPGQAGRVIMSVAHAPEAAPAVGSLTVFPM